MTSPSQLTKLLEEARMVDDWCKQFSPRRSPVERLCKIIEIQAEALAFYAEKGTWVTRSGKAGITQIYEDMDNYSYKSEYPGAYGKRARQALLDVDRIAGDGK